MKFLTLVLVMSSMTVFADEKPKTREESTARPVEQMVKEAKKERKKKIEMCHDCGKPESQCDCEGYVEEKRKD